MARSICNTLHLKSAIIIEETFLNITYRFEIFHLFHFNQFGVGMFVVYVLIELQPKIGEGIRRIIGVGNLFRSHQFLIVIIQDQVHFIVGLLLKIRMTRCTRCRAVFIWRWKFNIELCKLFLCMNAIKYS